MATVIDGKDTNVPAVSAGVNATASHDSDKLDADELFWANLQPWLAERGYKLRPRYQPGWKGSWLTEGFSGSRYQCEDSRTYIVSSADCVHTPLNQAHCSTFRQHPWVMDAVRVRDGALVMFKRVKKSPEDAEELEMAQFLSQETFVADRQSHCVEIYDILDIPGSADQVLLVMPLLYALRNRLEFETVGEVVDFFKQILEVRAYGTDIQFTADQRAREYRDFNSCINII